ncbi:QsdR family transcriptional regulator [Nocardia sp. CA-128927]|uniref:QsdR family transcriptional regulator n=1 Tax=Nocardia sp. CA-128927 TaxID=3239975 RepID=UPI003D96FC93
MSHEPEQVTPFAPDDPLLKIAVAMFERDGWIDLRFLAKAAGIGRATLYRRYGDRDRILGEVIWALSAPSIATLRPEFRGRGADGLAEMIGKLLHASAGHSGMRAFVGQHTDTALRVMTSKHGVIQQRFITRIAAAIRQEIGEPPDIDATTLAYAITRLGESFYYRELITGDPPDIDAATVIIRRLLTYPASHRTA